MRVTPAAYKLELSIMNQKMCFGIFCITCAVQTKNFNIFHYFFRKKIREIRYSRNVKLQSAITPVL